MREEHGPWYDLPQGISPFPPFRLARILGTSMLSNLADSASYPGIHPPIPKQRQTPLTRTDFCFENGRNWTKSDFVEYHRRFFFFFWKNLNSVLSSNKHTTVDRLENASWVSHRSAQGLIIIRPRSSIIRHDSFSVSSATSTPRVVRPLNADGVHKETLSYLISFTTQLFWGRERMLRAWRHYRMPANLLLRIFKAKLHFCHYCCNDSIPSTRSLQG